MAVDSHCHLDYDVFDEDRDAMMLRAADAGIDYMVSIGVELDKMPNILNIVNAHDHVFATAGIHPHHALEAPADSLQQLYDYGKNPKIIGLGETGLDYYYNKTGFDTQEKIFRQHIEVARHYDLPVIVHTRDAEDDTIRILQDALRTEGDFRILIHCFSGTSNLAEACLEMGAYLSISGIITFKKSEELRQTVSQVPLNRLLVETDSPYLAPMPHRGKRNEPAFTRYTLETVAQLHNMTYADADQQTTDNFFKLFNKASRIIKA
jgi:TatD DNase family protein